MKLVIVIFSTLLANCMTFSMTFAASSTPVEPAAVETKTTPPTHKPPTPLPATKQAISKACSVQADAKNLHGQEREKFRFECKKNGGKAL